MKSRFVKFMLSAAALAIFSFSAVHAAGELSFAGENGEEFVIAGRSVQIRAGELEPQRIPREYWRHRVQMCKAMGLNAVSSYFMWNDFERPDGSFDFKTGSRDVAAFLEICRQEGMWVLFRPGPYVCGEWDFGGLPSRLLKDDIAVRSTDPRYLNEAMKYLSAIADVAEPFLAKNGGPIILTQIENEYGSWPFKDAAYLRRLKDFWKRRGFSPFYMADGAGDWFLKDLIYPDREIAVGFDPGMNEKDWSFARKYNPGVPIFSSETYPGWLRHWGESSWRPSDISETIRWYM
jgi:beta-galactosidase